MRQLWFGGKIYTMKNMSDTVEAVLVENDKIIETGKLAELRDKADELLDLKGAVMYPGFVDSHLHLLGLGEKLRMLNFTDVTSKAELLAQVAGYGEKLDGETWLIGVGWDENQFTDGAIPSLAELDTLYEGPIFLKRVCRHAALVNSSGLAIAGIDAETEDPSTGRIGRDDAGRLNGLLYDEAMDMVTDTFEKSGPRYIDMLTQDMTAAVNALLEVGITGAHTEDMSYFGAYTNPLTAFRRVIGEQQNFRAHLLRHHKVFEEMMADDVAYLDGFIEPGAMKIFIDGALGGSTAALSEAYHDDPENKGLLLYSDEELESLVLQARQHGEAVAAHVIGDAAVEQILNMIERYPVPAGKRDRLIHASILRPDLIERLKKVNVVIDAQPCFVASDFPWLIDRIGEARTKYVYAWKSLIDANIPVAFGTDSPIEDISPLENIYAAVARKSLDDNSDGYGVAEKLSRFEAVRAYTVGSAQAICKADVRGMIEPGFDADFTVFDRDLLTCDLADLLEAKVEKTVVAGRLVYEKK